MLSFLSSLVFGKELAISSKKVTKAPQDFTQAEEDRMPPKMTATYHTCLQAVFTNTKQQVNNERQLEKEESGQKLPMKIVPRSAGWRSSLYETILKKNKSSRIRNTETFFNKTSVKANKS